jgi:hypothetical protein
VNREFCTLFGIESGQLATSNFRILQGPLTNSKHLQEVWSEVRRGADKTVTCNLYHRAGEMLVIKLHAMLRACDVHASRTVFVLRMSLVRTEPAAADPPRMATARSSSHRNAASGANAPVAVGAQRRPEVEMERLMRRLEALLPRAEMDRLRRSMEGLVPKARLEAAEAEVVNTRLTSV